MIDVYRKYEHCVDLMIMFNNRSQKINWSLRDRVLFSPGRHPINELMGYFQYIPTGLSGCFILIVFITAATKYSNA
jgi:hypothetical protein